MTQTQEKKIILIVDDSSVNQEFLTQIIDNSEFEIIHALDGKVALEQAKQRLPDLILLDVIMPEMGGFEACVQLKSDPQTSEIPIIFMTALSDIEAKVKGLSLGAVDYITKPFQKEEVLARIHVHIQLHNLTKNLENQVAYQKEQLSSLLGKLKQTQVQLVQTEKMSSLGQLLAGVAHEINNPINFIHGNIIHASQYINDLLEMIELYGEQTETTEELDELAEDIDLEFIKEDLPKLLNSMKIGSERIREIVQSLRNFSRLDESDTKTINIHEGIDSTLMILGHRIKAKSDRPAINIVKQYGDLPPVECYPGQMNQVFMNILSNAIDALEEQRYNEGFNPTISIYTELLDSNSIRIRIADNGPGMPESVQKQMFDPFFTTKPVGKGTGMGMSISRQIVLETHHGELTFSSELGQGTEFLIELPVEQPDKESQDHS
jgi:two-component system, NtrC family, sensor kinase